MSKNSWVDDGSRLDERKVDAPDVPKRGRRKKTRKWCKGKVGVKHQPEIVLDEKTLPWRTHNGDRPPCYRPDWLRQGGRLGRRPLAWSWLCSHIERCAACGKILEHTLNERCPDYTTEITVRKGQ